VTFTDLDERASVLEDAIFTDLYREEIAGLRVDVAALDSRIHADITAVIMQVNEIRGEILTTRSALRTEMTAFKSSVERRFDAVDRRFESLDKRFDSLDAKLDECLSEMRGGKRER
jgi:chromosome segregation ATPase